MLTITFNEPMNAANGVPGNLKMVIKTKNAAGALTTLGADLDDGWDTPVSKVTHWATYGGTNGTTKLADSTTVLTMTLTDNEPMQNKIMAMYSKGMSQRDIVDNLREIYGAEISQSLISKITDKILPEVNEWQNRPLESIYPIIYFDGIVFKSRKDSQIINKCVYSVLGIDMNGQKDILGIWISENESASFYASICSDLKKRGVQDVFIACHDNLKGLGEAINAVFPKTKQQLCIVHQIRNSTKFVQYKDRKAICADLKKIYGAVNLDDAEYAKEDFREKWDRKYPSILRSWDANWAELTTFFNYPEQIRYLVYTTYTDIKTMPIFLGNACFSLHTE